MKTAEQTTETNKPIEKVETEFNNQLLELFN